MVVATVGAHKTTGRSGLAGAKETMKGQILAAPGLAFGGEINSQRKMRTNLITIMAVAVTILNDTGDAGEVIRSPGATKAALTLYWSQHNDHGLRAVNTTATTLRTLSGRPYAVFTVDAVERVTGFPVRLAMVYDVNAKVMYALWLNKANQFLKTGDRSLLKTAAGSEAVDLS